MKKYDSSGSLFLIINSSDFRCVHNQKENCHYDHISFKLKVFIYLFLESTTGSEFRGAILNPSITVHTHKFVSESC